MDIERTTELVLKTLLGDLDPATDGAVVEVGLGSLNYSFRWAVPLGYRCLAVEPLPTTQLRAAAAEFGVPVLEMALAAESGEAPIYHGRLNGFDLPDISSLNPNWWGVSDQFTLVATRTLSDFCEAHDLDAIALLKVDAEGSEADILAALPRLPLTVRPKLLMIEYGGGGVARSSGKAGWTAEFQKNLIMLLGVVASLDYRSTVVFESTKLLPVLRKGTGAFDPDVLFSPKARVGNLVFVRDDAVTNAADEALCSLRHRLFLAAIAHKWAAFYRGCDYQWRRLRQATRNLGCGAR